MVLCKSLSTERGVGYVLDIAIPTIWGSVGIGRRIGLKIQGWKQREGSSPFSPTNICNRGGIWHTLVQ